MHAALPPSTLQTLNCFGLGLVRGAVRKEWILVEAMQRNHTTAAGVCLQHQRRGV